MDTNEVLLGEPTSFIGISYWDMGEELLTGTKITQKQLHFQSQPRVGLTKMGTWSTQDSLKELNRLKSVPSSCFH